MKSIIFKNRWVQIVYGILLMVAGILTIVFAVNNSTNLTSAISIVVAVCCFILGLVYIASSFASETKVLFPPALFFASLCIAVGVLLCCKPTILGDVIVYVAAGLLLSYGVVILVKAISFIVIKAKVIHIVLFFLLGAVLTTLGILAFVYRDTANIVIYVGTGVAIAIYGLIEVIVAIKHMIKANKGNETVVRTQHEKKGNKEIEHKDDNIIDAKVEPEVVDKTK